MPDNDLPSPSPNGTFRVSDLVAVAAVATVLAVWTSVAAGHFSPAAWLGCQAICFVLYGAGTLVSSWSSLGTGIRFDLPLRLLFGYLTINTSLFALSVLSPLGIVANFSLLALVVAVLLILRRPMRVREPWRTPDLAVLVLALAAATLWCRDSLSPMQVKGATTLIKPWLDGFYHAVHVRMFAESHGAASIEDFRMAGVPARLYHYAAYLTPGLVSRISGLSGYTLFSGLMVPLGIFFVGLAAYVLVASFLGPWPALAAAAAVLLLPDGAQQGLHNTFMSYHWLMQISPGATFGLAVLAVGWLFVLRGCLDGKALQVLVGWLIAAISVSYKAQFFVANALLLFLAPPLFFRGLKLRWRLPWLGTAVAVYILGVYLVQRLPGMPLIRLDGSSTGRLLATVNSFADPGSVRLFFDRYMGPRHSLFQNVEVGAVYYLVTVLGVFAPLLFIATAALWRRLKNPLVSLPPLFVLNFLVMALGLALDNRGVATPEELPHRPFVWMYFVVVTSLGALAGLVLVRSKRLERFSRPILLSAVFGLLAFPAVTAAGIQRISTMNTASYVPYSTALLQAADYMHAHGDRRDVFQDSAFDTNYLVSALSGRRAYVERTFLRLARNEELESRVVAVTKLMQVQAEAAVRAEAQRLGIRWFLARPGQALAWPAEIALHPAFAKDGYRLYGFEPR
jgi:hypothetical protein